MSRRSPAEPLTKAARAPRFGWTAALLLLLFACAARPAVAGPSAETVRAGEIQQEAGKALEDGNLDLALRLARQAIGLDPSASTWLAQQVRIEVLERKGRLDEARDAVDRYLDLDGLFPEHLAWGEDASTRIRAALDLRDRAFEEAQRRVRTRRSAGIGLAAAGLAPLGVGIGFIANFAHQGGQPDLSGGWIDAGVPILLVGVAIEGVGIALIGSSAKKPEPSRLSRRGPVLLPPLAAPLPGGGGVVVAGFVF